MVLASPSSSAVSPSATVSTVIPRSGRFRRLTYLRSHSLGDSNPRSNDTRQQAVPTSSQSSTSGTITDRNPVSSLSGTAAPSPDPVQPTSGWLPASQPTTQLQSAAVSSLEPSTGAESGGPHNNMTRRRSATTPATLPTSSASSGTTRARANNNSAEAQARSPPTSGTPQSSRFGTPQMPSIRFVNYQDGRASRPSLGFPTISRTLPHLDSVIRVGRYSEKDAPPESVGDGPSDAPVGFKSKVVSRKHCEFSFKDSHWWIKDTKSSSGTFLNRIRLSQPNVESKPYKLNDGDVVQLGIDFKGGEESIFRCVKIRIYCNKSWQQKKNNFNTSTHKQLQQLTKSQGGGSTETSSRDSTDCTICLCAIAPCQALFIAPCSHTWHYKCIRPIIMEHGDYHYPEFLCPNCRAVADLEEDVEESEQWEDHEAFDDLGINGQSEEDVGTGLPQSDDNNDPESPHQISEDDEFTTHIGRLDLGNEPLRPVSPMSPEEEIEGISSDGNFRPPIGASGSLKTSVSSIVPSPSVRTRPHAGRFADWHLPGWQLSPPLPTHIRSISPPTTPSEQRNGDNEDEFMSPLAAVRTVTSGPVPAFLVGSDPEGPITPRNNAGPFVFDGTAGATTIGEGRDEGRG